MLGGSNPNLGNRQSQHTFAQRPAVHMARSQFDRSHAAKDTIYFDQLTPILIDEVIPGDTANLKLNTFARLSTQLVPIMDNMYIDFFFFFVPNRLVWTNWEKMCGAQDNPGDSTSYIFPTITPGVGGVQVGDLFDKFGLPVGVGGSDAAVPQPINALPSRCYNLIYNQWFRDENLQNSLTVDMDDGPDTYATYANLQLRGKRHDYFTSALPFLQKAPAVTLPLGTTAPVYWDSTTTNAGLIRNAATGALSTATPLAARTVTGVLSKTVDDGTNLVYDPNHTLLANLSTATAATINQLRQAFQMQSLFELDARGGTRYVEILQAHYNVTSPDFRLQRAEYLGGGSQKISSHPVPQTSTTSAGNPQAQLAAFGTSASNGSIGFTKSFVEHGYIIGLCCPRADLTYQQGVNRMWLKSTRYDGFWPKLQELGEQAITNNEIYLQGTTADAGIFGYQERYAEYRFKPSEIRGEFRSAYSTPLDYWHLAQDFGSLPALNSTFIKQSTPIGRAIYAPSAPHLLIDMWFDYKQARPMVTYSTPVSLGRF